MYTAEWSEVSSMFFLYIHFMLNTFYFSIFSGMVVRDRPKRKNDADEVFKQAKRKGAKQGPFEARRRSSRSRNFTGTGRLLTGETVQRDAPPPPEETVHNIYFWSNGFTVNDGPLRSFDDPENSSFLEVKNFVLYNLTYHISALLLLC